MLDEQVVDIESQEVVGDPAISIAEKVSNKIVDPTVYSVADLKLNCSRCGNVDTLQEGIQGGLRFDLYTTDQHNITLQCSACGTRLAMYWEENKGAEYEPVSEEDKGQE